MGLSLERQMERDLGKERESVYEASEIVPLKKSVAWIQPRAPTYCRLRFKRRDRKGSGV